MSNNDRYERASHTVTDIQYHFVWITKYRYKVLKGKVALRCRELIIQGCEVYGIQILEGNIVSDHIHLHVKAPATMSPTEIMQKLKGRSSHMLQEEFPELHKMYWGSHMWGRGYFCSAVGAVNEETIKSYIEDQGEDDNKNFKITE